MIKPVRIDSTKHLPPPLAAYGGSLFLPAHARYRAAIARGAFAALLTDHVRRSPRLHVDEPDRVGAAPMRWPLG